jgi:hypothetical protein
MSRGKNTATYKFKCTKKGNGTVEIKFFLNSYETASGLGVCQPTLYNHLNGKTVNKKLKDWTIEQGKWAKYEPKERDITTII